MKGTEAASGAAGKVSRRRFVAAAQAVLAGLAWASKPGRAGTGEVEWLDEVQRPPSRLPPEAPDLPPLLVGPGGTPIRSQAQWESERKRIRRDWMRFLGPMPADRPPLEMEVLEEEELDGALVRQLVRYNAEAGVRVEGYLLAPAAASERDRRAGVVVLHQTSSLTIDLVAGVNGPEEAADRLEAGSPRLGDLLSALLSVAGRRQLPGGHGALQATPPGCPLHAQDALGRHARGGSAGKPAPGGCHPHRRGRPLPGGYRIALPGRLRRESEGDGRQRRRAWTSVSPTGTIPGSWVPPSAVPISS